MKPTVRLEEDEDLRLEWAECFFNCITCEDFEIKSTSINWEYCPVCLEDRNTDGEIRHKDKKMLYN